MYIIADIEWVENQSGRVSPTQISAARVDGQWNEVEQYTSYIKPQDSTFHSWEHVAYMGGKVSDFLEARACCTVLEEFREWVGEDTVCWWFPTSAEIYARINKALLGVRETSKPILLSEYILGALHDQKCVRGTPYKLARARDIDVPRVEHNSRNDVIAVLNLLKGVSFPQKALLSPPVKPSPHGQTPNGKRFKYQYEVSAALLHKGGCPLLPENVEVLGYDDLTEPVRKKYKPCICIKTELHLAKLASEADEKKERRYTYVYIESDSAFHQKGCSLLHGASHVLGAVKYETLLAKGLHPCKVCCPSFDGRPRMACEEKKTEKAKKAKGAAVGHTRTEKTALKRLKESQKERFSGALDANMTKQEKNDLFTLTQPRYGFFAVKGYRSFHMRSCSRLTGKSDIKGFDTFSHAKRAGYTPCKYCKPTQKHDVLVSIPITSKLRGGESVADLITLCGWYGYKHRYAKGELAVETPVGKWIVHTDARPVALDHINLVKTPGCKTYHKQHRIFLSMTDAMTYIHKHDSALLHDDGDVV